MIGQGPLMYQYTYLDKGSDKIKLGYDQVPYLPGDTVVFLPSKRVIIIQSVKVGNTILTLNNYKHGSRD
jgi:hypothetical protein